MRWAYALIVAVSACASSTPRRDPSPIPRTFDESATPPDLTRFTMVEEGATGPSHPELRPYVRKHPLVRITQFGSPEESPPPGSFDLVAFDDGKVFFEGSSCVTAFGFRARTLTAEELLGLRKTLTELCPALRMPQGFCTDSSSVAITCHLGAADFSGSDGCHTDTMEWRAAKEIVTKVGADAWVGHVTNPRCSFEGHHAAMEIERTLVPIPWKRYTRGVGDRTP
jgi:hypothetical protein